MSLEYPRKVPDMFFLFSIMNISVPFCVGLTFIWPLYKILQDQDSSSGIPVFKTKREIEK